MNTEDKLLYTPDQVDALIAEMAEAIGTRLQDAGIDNPGMIGIHSGGVWVARRLHRLLGLKEPLGTLDISFYRDDFTRIGVNPVVEPSELPFNLDDRHLILVDDVLHTGRTVRAALNELFDYGRPASVTLAVLVDRGCRELPVEAQIVGLRRPMPPEEHITLTGPETLALAQGKGKGSKRKSREQSSQQELTL